MESKPTALFFNGTNIGKIENEAIKNVDRYRICTNNVYLVNEPIYLLAGVKDATGNLDLDEGDMFLTFSRYEEDDWKYYRFKIHSKELAEFMIESEKRNTEQDFRRPMATDCCEKIANN